ncbi:DNA-directed RNA polymerase II [Actinomyces sp. ZJ308]|uniref:DNA-directed RNA polymerase II n=1 Tax=Actinomyces sp. ZJ308 TaxID=2708342 RepID=UPI001421A8BD|nr:DNA-directed RNA polymerase II [Actinomyces sp. ZJ308]
MLVIVCSVLLASLVALVSTSPAARADTKTDPSTTGTASTVSPSTVAVGGTIMYTVSGFPGGVTVQVLIDDGALVASRPSESEVVTTITIKQDGTASGSFELPEYVEQGSHWLRFRVSGAQGVTAQEGNAADYTNKSPYFTVSGVTVIGGAAPPTVPPAPTPPPHQVAATGGSSGSGASGIQAAGPSAEPAGFPIIGTSILVLSMILVVLSVLVAVNRRRMADYQRRRATI